VDLSIEVMKLVRYDMDRGILAHVEIIK
jgi:hypothetical protein